MSVFVWSAKGLRIPMATNSYNLLVDKRAIGTGKDFASSDVGFATRALDLLDQNFIHRQRTEFQSLNGLLSTTVELQVISQI